MKLLWVFTNIPTNILLTLIGGAFLTLFLAACSSQATERIIRILDALQRMYYGSRSTHRCDQQQKCSRKRRRG